MTIVAKFPHFFDATFVSHAAKTIGTFLVISLGSNSYSTSTMAQDNIFEVTIDTAQLLELQVDSATILIGNPGIADVSVNTPKTIFVIGLTIGETNLVALDKMGEVILESNVVVLPKADRQVTIHRGSGSVQNLSCHPHCSATTNGESTPSAPSSTATVSSSP